MANLRGITGLTYCSFAGRSRQTLTSRPAGAPGGTDIQRFTDDAAPRKSTGERGGRRPDSDRAGSWD